MEVQYQYKPLTTSSSIRVLKLYPASDLEARVCCDLVEVSMSAKPEYCAVSYSWDGQERIASLDCAGKQLFTTPNCLAALRQFRDVKAELLLWVDSLCIDQSSIAERSQQVALMGDIYKTAHNVLVWLGEGNTATDIAIETLKNLVDTNCWRLRPINYSRTSNTNELCESDIQSVIHGRVQRLKEDVTAEAQDPIGSLFQRSWFTRLWTVQEVSLPIVPNALVYCGTSSIHWMQLVGAVDALRAKRYPWGRYHEAMHVQKYATIMLASRRNPMLRALLANKPGDTVQTLHVSHILTFARKQCATDPKDKVFALLGLLAELGFSCMVPNYGDTIEEIYAKAAAMVIENDKDLYVLFQVPSDKRRSGLVSWAPDWSDPGWEDFDSRTALTRDRFCAAGPSSPVWNFSRNYLHLNLFGRLLDTIIYRAEEIDMLNADPFKLALHAPRQDEEGTWIISDLVRNIHDCFKVMRCWVDVSKWHAEYPTGEDLRDVLRRTLINDNPETQGKKQHQASFEAWYRVMVSSDTELVTDFLASLGLPAKPHQTPEQMIQQCMREIPEEI